MTTGRRCLCRQPRERTRGELHDVALPAALRWFWQRRSARLPPGEGMGLWAGRPIERGRPLSEPPTTRQQMGLYPHQLGARATQVQLDIGRSCGRARFNARQTLMPISYRTKLHLFAIFFGAIRRSSSNRIPLHRDLLDGRHRFQADLWASLKFPHRQCRVDYIWLFGVALQTAFPAKFSLFCLAGHISTAAQYQQATGVNRLQQAPDGRAAAVCTEEQHGPGRTH